MYVISNALAIYFGKHLMHPFNIHFHKTAIEHNLSRATTKRLPFVKTYCDLRRWREPDGGAIAPLHHMANIGRVSNLCWILLCTFIWSIIKSKWFSFRHERKFSTNKSVACVIFLIVCLFSLCVEQTMHWFMTMNSCGWRHNLSTISYGSFHCQFWREFRQKAKGTTTNELCFSMKIRRTDDNNQNAVPLFKFNKKKSMFWLPIQRVVAPDFIFIVLIMLHFQI